MRSTAEINQESNSALVKIDVSEEELEPFVRQAISRLRSQVRVPGFRKGHVPTPVLVSRLGPDTLRREALDDLVQERYEDIVVENGLDVIEQPKLNLVSGEVEGDISAELEVKLRPTVTVEGVGSIEIEVPPLGISAEDVQSVIDAIREQMAELEDVERAVQQGDQVTFNVISVGANGEEEVVTPYLTGRIGKFEVSASYEQVLLGAKIGDRVRVLEQEASVSGEVNGGESEGQAADSDGERPETILEVTAIREVKLPELTDEFAAQLSEFKTVAELEEDVRNTVSSRRLMDARSSFEQQLYQRVLDLAEPKTLPESLVNQAYQQELHELGHALDGSHISLKRYLEMSQLDELTLASQLSSKAARSILWDLALRAVAVSEGVTVEEDEIDAEAERMIATGAIDPKSGELSPLQRVQIRTSIAKQKAYKRLANLVSIKDSDGNPVTLESLGFQELSEVDGEGQPDAGEDAPSGDES